MIERSGSGPSEARRELATGESRPLESAPRVERVVDAERHADVRPSAERQRPRDAHVHLRQRFAFRGDIADGVARRRCAARVECSQSIVASSPK